MLCAGACSSGTAVDSNICPQTYEFGNYGCARVVALLVEPITPLPATYRLDVRAVWPRDGSIAAISDAGVNPRIGAVPLTITLYDRSQVPAADTASVWLIARVLDTPAPIPGAPLLTFAVDSVIHVVRFAAVGAMPRVDTVRLVLQRP